MRISSMPNPAEPAIATPEWRSAGCSFCTSRCAMELPAVARRSAAITTPSSKVTAAIVVPWRSSFAASADVVDAGMAANGSAPIDFR
jgi:hypothetical protein